MSVQSAVVAALKSFIEQTGMSGRAILVGGQALRDWYAREAFMRTALAHQSTSVQPRATTDIDILLLIDDPDRSVLERTLTDGWDRDARKTFRFHWRHDRSITLDLVTVDNADARTRVKCLVKIGTGGDMIGAARVIPGWILDIPLTEPCHTPDFGLLGINRLSHLGLLASKLTAVNNVVDALAQAGRPGGKLPDWLQEENRLSKDLQDIRMLLDIAWVGRIWAPLNQRSRQVSAGVLREAIALFRSLQSRPPLMSGADFDELRILGPIAARILS